MFKWLVKGVKIFLVFLVMCCCFFGFNVFKVCILCRRLVSLIIIIWIFLVMAKNICWKFFVWCFVVLEKLNLESLVIFFIKLVVFFLNKVLICLMLMFVFFIILCKKFVVIIVLFFFKFCSSFVIVIGWVM